ncbi:ATP-binding protein [Pseudomonas fragi]|uniref:AAA family ATPase n=1 Tax=Pseudomonas fragi TaxID=296 RepID=UPI00147518C6|nr:AAA family ATPase [Pseudomonas fragi]NNB60868.1 ATP-binding protein [Pseudomonas fragi]
MKAFPKASTKVELGYSENKEVVITSIAGIAIKRFRTMYNQDVFLGKNITVFSGRNGTMKTSLMGLIAHPFNSVAQDVFGRVLKTPLKEVFKLSPDFDKEKYEYDLILQTDKGESLRETVSMYFVGDKTNRHRVVVSGAEKGDGNFTYNTSFLNLKRLYPLVDTKAVPDQTKSLDLTLGEAADLKDYFETVLPSSEYNKFTAVHEKNFKTTFAPAGDGARYDWLAISSGEDNLGSIFNRLLGFSRSFKDVEGVGNGILCIDEFESSLHPVAQLRLFDYLQRWSSKYKVQVIVSTHSLHLISHIYLEHSANLEKDRIVVNFVSKSTASDGNYPILRNPAYELAYKELTLQDPEEVAQARKIRVFCEDEFAIHFVKRLVKSRKILGGVEFHSSLNKQENGPGTSYSALRSLCVQFPLLLERSLVIFDADVPSTVTSKIKNKNLFLTLPDSAGLAIERRIIVYILGLSNDHKFFEKFGKERERFLLEFKDAGIKSLSVEDISSEVKTSIASCKSWAEKSKVKFKEYVTYYADNAHGKDDFVMFFLAAVNRLNSASGMPMLTK